MNQIRCKAKHKAKNGCIFCGGYKVVYMKKKCELSGCKNFGWVRPGSYTIYEGKEFNTVDGQTFVYRGINSLCKDCDIKTALTRSTK